MKRMPAAEFKRDFSKVLDAVQRGEQVLVLRHGKPVAVIGPVPEPEGSITLPKPKLPGGLLSMIGALADWETFEEDMAEIVASRQYAVDRPPPEFD